VRKDYERQEISAGDPPNGPNPGLERVKGGPGNARAKGKWLGRPPKDLDKEAIAALRHKGLGWRAIAS
jgi:hypothetical protein